jgi:hypothetical protein
MRAGYGENSPFVWKDGLVLSTAYWRRPWWYWLAGTAVAELATIKIAKVSFDLAGICC